MLSAALGLGAKGRPDRELRLPSDGMRASTTRPSGSTASGANVAGSARALLAEIPIKGRVGDTGYARPSSVQRGPMSIGTDATPEMTSSHVTSRRSRSEQALMTAS